MYQTFIILGLCILSTVGAQLFLKKGVLALGSFYFSISNLMGLIPRVIQNIWLMGGLILLGIGFFLWLFVISRIKLSMAYPVSTSLNLCLIILGSWLIFKEQLLPVQILGVVIIVLGIFLVLKP